MGRRIVILITTALTVCVIATGAAVALRLYEPWKVRASEASAVQVNISNS